MDSFDEHSYKGQEIMNDFEVMLMMAARHHKISFKTPPHDIARRFMNEIVEFEPGKEV